MYLFLYMCCVSLLDSICGRRNNNAKIPYILHNGWLNGRSSEWHRMKIAYGRTRYTQVIRRRPFGFILFHFISFVVCCSSSPLSSLLLLLLYFVHFICLFVGYFAFVAFSPFDCVAAYCARTFRFVAF